MGRWKGVVFGWKADLRQQWNAGKAPCFAGKQIFDKNGPLESDPVWGFKNIKGRGVRGVGGLRVRCTSALYIVANGVCASVNLQLDNDWPASF